VRCAIAALRSRVKFSPDTVGVPALIRADPVERCDGKLFPGAVGIDRGLNRPAWTDRFWRLHSLRTTLEAPRRSL